MRLTVIFASDFTGLVEYSLALILWGIGIICAITAVAFTRSRKPGRRGGPFAFFAIICSMIILFLVVSVAAHSGRVEFTPLIAGILPGMAGVLCLVHDRPRPK